MHQTNDLALLPIPTCIIVHLLTDCLGYVYNHRNRTTELCCGWGAFGICPCFICIELQIAFYNKTKLVIAAHDKYTLWSVQVCGYQWGMLYRTVILRSWDWSNGNKLQFGGKIKQHFGVESSHEFRPNAIYISHRNSINTRFYFHTSFFWSTFSLCLQIIICSVTHYFPFLLTFLL